MRAHNVDEFRRALRGWRAPAVNYVCADTSGNIGWMAAGLTPIRRTWDGLLPVPGDGRHEWDGFLDPDLLPASINPPIGFVASANAMNLPGNWNRIERPMGYEWDDPSRARRIDEVLSVGQPHSIAASLELQRDLVSLPARRLCAWLERTSWSAGGPHAALTLLGAWNHRLAAESDAAALFEVWWSNHLKPAVVERLVKDAAARRLLMPGDVETILTAIDDMPPTDREALLLNTLDGAYRRCEALMGDPDRWSWGRLHKLELQHAVWKWPTPAARPAPGAEIAPIPLGGSESTVNKAAYRANDFGVVMGPSVRMVIDVGGWDQSVWINIPGQSADPRSPHYADLVSIWASGEYVPMAYSRDAVDRVTERRIVIDRRV
jgi:penicillin amidase